MHVSISSFWCLGPFLIDLLAVSFTCVPCNRAEIILSETGHQQSSLYILECIKKSRKLLYHVLASYLMHGMSSNNSVAKFNILNCIFTRSTTHLKLRLYAIMHFSICNSIFVCFSKVWYIILGICALNLTHPSTNRHIHTHTHTHTHTHAHIHIDL